MADELQRLVDLEAIRALKVRYARYADAGYDEAVIGSTSRDALWLLSRRPRLAPERRQALVQLARDRGFDVERLRFSEAAPAQPA